MNCGETFITTKYNAKFCCDECRYEGQLKRQRLQKAAKRAAEKAQALSLPTGTNEEVIAAQDAAEGKIA